MKLKALKPIGRLRPGEVFDVPRAQARVLKAIGKAEDYVEPAPGRRAYRRRDMIAADTRDMTADDQE